jgi:hypothetical protein
LASESPPLLIDTAGGGYTPTAASANLARFAAYLDQEVHATNPGDDIGVRDVHHYLLALW